MRSLPSEPGDELDPEPEATLDHLTEEQLERLDQVRGERSREEVARELGLVGQSSGAQSRSAAPSSDGE